MKVIAAFVASLAAVSAFAPAPAGRASTQVDALFDDIFNMDLFNPVKDQNDYGARGKKNLKQGTIGDNSYIPAGLTAAQYTKIREKESKKKDANYQRNVAKAGKFMDYTKFYLDRGTDTSQAWYKSATRGHDMAKTKYDYDNITEGKKYDGVAKTGKKSKR